MSTPARRKKIITRRKRGERRFSPDSEYLKRAMSKYKAAGGRIEKLESPDKYYEAGAYPAASILSQFEH